MPRQIFINLAVKDLKKTMEFFTTLGFTFDKTFTDDNAACLIIAENIYVMLLVEKFFSTFTKKPISDATKTVEVMNAFTVGSREEVDDMVKKAVAAGASTPIPVQDHGWMYSHSFQDLDGHIWEPFFMDKSKMPTNPSKT